MKTATQTKTQFADINGKSLAYRTLGAGKPLILCHRFRANLDHWDPAFLDTLAQSFQVIIFNYAGFASSKGNPATTMLEFAKDIADLSEALELKDVIVGGWSFGGMVAQVAAIEFPGLISKIILIGTNPPGVNQYPFEEIFFEVSRIWEYNLGHEEILFFEPDSEKSKKAAQLSHDRIAQRTVDNDIPVAEPLWDHYTLGFVDFEKDEQNYREKLATIKIPVLMISGDHDLCFPVQNWFALSRILETTQFIVLPKSGHGPQHQFPQLTANYIRDFDRFSDENSL